MEGRNAAATLATGSIADISDGLMISGIENRPALQVVDLRLVQTTQNTNERYRMMLSDGVHMQQAMLATQMNGMVKTGVLKKGTIVQLNEFICNLIQNRKIIIVLNMDIVLESCDPIGDPKSYETGSKVRPPVTASSHSGSHIQPKTETVTTNVPFSGPSSAGSLPPRNVSTPTPPRPKPDPGARTNANLPQNSSYVNRVQNPGMGAYPTNSMYGRSVPTYQQAHPPPLYQNRGPIAKNEAPARIMPIAALNPYQGRWTIKARVTAKGELRRYNSPRGEGKVFSFDLLDSDGGEIRATCFNAVADQFYDQISAGNVYLLSRGSLKPAQKNFNHLNNDYEIFLENTSTLEPCLEEDNTIPKQLFNFRSIGEIEGIENNSMVDLIGIVSSINPSSTILRKNGTETVKRTLGLKDMSGRSVEITLWGNFCSVEGQQLQTMCDSGVFPVLAIKAGRVSDFGGKSVGTISSSQLFINPDFPETQKLKDWYNREGKNVTSISISREMSSMGKTDMRKTISQIKDEGLGRSEKPDWITVKATISFMKTDNFCYTACPLMLGERQCNKKVNNNGDGNWHCDRCEQSFPECDYRYLLQLQIQDHTGLTWVSAFQEGGEQIMEVSAKDLYLLKYEEQDDVKFADIIRGVLFHQYLFKLKIKEEMFNDEQRVKSTVVKAEKLNPSSESRYLLGVIDSLLGKDPTAVSGMTGGVPSDSRFSNAGYSNNAQTTYGASNYMGSTGNAVKYNKMDGPPQHAKQYGSDYGSVQNAGNRMQSICSSCGSAGHNPLNCPRAISGQNQPMGGGFVNRSSYTGNAGGITSGGASGNCYKCQQPGHWARDCPGANTISSSYRSSSGNTPKQYGF